MDWRERAACRTVDPETFFPVGTGPVADEQSAQAKSICHQRCPVLSQCRSWALESGQCEGVWGGLDADELRATLRRQGRRRSGRRPAHVRPA